MITLDDVRAAHENIRALVRHTPLVHATNLSAATGIELHLKLETMQVTGSFKERGAANCLLQLDDEARARGVIAASAGNHAQGVAVNATRLGIDATIVMPEYTPLVKLERTRRYGAKVILHGASFDDANTYAKQLCDEREATFVPPFDHPHIIAGQGTCGLEILADGPDLDVVVVPIGGGGLIAGVALAIKETRPDVQVIGVESKAFPSMTAALRTGVPTTVDTDRTIADGIAVRTVGKQTLGYAQRYVDDVITVSEDAIANALVMLLEEERVVSEGAAATTLAAVMSDALRSQLQGKRVALLISGGNLDVNMMERIIERGLVRAGRRARFTLGVPDRPGTLARLTELVAQHGCNVLEIRHERAFAKTAVGETELEVEIETTGPEALAALRAELEHEGYTVA